MKYVLTFSSMNARYSCHAEGCSALASPKRHIFVCDHVGPFESIALARIWADADESDKAGYPTRANWKVCPCTKEKPL